MELTPEIRSARSRWQYRGQLRPPFAQYPADTEESVWDYPRPPAVERVHHRLTVRDGTKVIAETSNGRRVLETAGAPTYYFPPGDVFVDLMIEQRTTLCEWKGRAQSLQVLSHAGAAWRYVELFPEYEGLYLWVSFYPALLACYVDEELASPQPGGYYGGWMTTGIVGPVKGGPGSEGW